MVSLGHIFFEQNSAVQKRISDGRWGWWEMSNNPQNDHCAVVCSSSITIIIIAMTMGLAGRMARQQAIRPTGRMPANVLQQGQMFCSLCQIWSQDTPFISFVTLVSKNFAAYLRFLKWKPFLAFHFPQWGLKMLTAASKLAWLLIWTLHGLPLD